MNVGIRLENSPPSVLTLTTVWGTDSSTDITLTSSTDITVL